jgi:chromosome segregation ATPase
VPESANLNFVCPCCRKNMVTPEEVQVFVASLKSLETDPQLVDDRAKDTLEVLRSNYSKWRKTVQDNMSDVMDYHRLTNEALELEGGLRTASEELTTLKATLKEGSEKEAHSMRALNKLNDLLNLSKRWLEDATRISDKQTLISQKRVNLQVRSVGSGRNLRQVEEAMTRSAEEKDLLSNKMNKLNKEMTNLNAMMTKLSTQV